MLELGAAMTDGVRGEFTGRRQDDAVPRLPLDQQVFLLRVAMPTRRRNRPAGV